VELREVALFVEVDSVVVAVDVGMIASLFAVVMNNFHCHFHWQ